MLEHIVIDRSLLGSPSICISYRRTILHRPSLYSLSCDWWWRSSQLLFFFLVQVIMFVCFVFFVCCVQLGCLSFLFVCFEHRNRKDPNYLDLLYRLMCFRILSECLITIYICLTKIDCVRFITKHVFYDSIQTFVICFALPIKKYMLRKTVWDINDIHSIT
jgi:hypothetical protein